MNEAATRQRSRADDIVEHATAMFLKKGFAATSMSGVAASVGIQKASLYHHFESKEALFIACVVTGYEGTLQNVEGLLDDDTLTDEERLERIIDIAYDSIVNSAIGRMSPIIAETSRTIPGIARRFFDEYIARMHRSVHAVLVEGAERGVFRPMDLRTIELMIFAPIVHLSLSRQMFCRFDDLSERYDVETTKAIHLEQVRRLLQPV
jgi:AcrR family transcriptional regulator